MTQQCGKCKAREAQASSIVREIKHNLERSRHFNEQARAWLLELDACLHDANEPTLISPRQIEVMGHD